MGDQKIINLLEYTTNQLSKFRTKNLVEINGDAHGFHSAQSQIKFKNTVSQLRLCDYSDTCILVKGTIAVVGEEADTALIATYKTIKKLIYKNYSPSNDCISEINKTQAENANDLDVVMPMYNLIEHSQNCSNISGRFWQYCRGEPNDNITDSDNLNSNRNLRTILVMIVLQM